MVVFVLGLAACGSENSVPSDDPSVAVAPSLAAPSTPAPATPNAEPLNHCAADDDCVVARDECDQDVAVRGDQESVYRERVQARRADVTCEPHGGGGTPWDQASAVCVDTRCRIVARGGRCSEDSECTIVDAGCGLLRVVNVAAEPEVRAALELQASVRECLRELPPPALAPRCVERACIGADMGDAALRRGCRSAQQCTAVPGVCGVWKVIARLHLQAAQRVFHQRAAGLVCGDQENEDPPNVACVNGYCVPAA